MKMKYIAKLIAIFIIAANQWSYAQPKPVKPIIKTNNDPVATKWLSFFNKKYIALASYKIDYTVTVKSAEDKELEKFSGNYIASGKKFYLTTNKSVMISDGATIWNINTKNKEVQINALGKKKNIETPIDVLTHYDKNFKYRMKNEKDGDVDAIELIPLDKNSTIFKIDLTIDTKNQKIIASKIYDKNGMRIYYAIHSIEGNPKAASSFFHFDSKKFKGYEILDLRD